MDKIALINYAKSVMLNLDTGHLAECLSKGVDVSNQTPRDRNGWHRVGRYAAGKQSARVQANKLRKKWSNLETQVRGTTTHEWSAELWARVRETTES